MIQSEFVHETVRRVWGYDRFLPLQGEAIAAILDGRDSIVVLPTGGGKSLCYQAPAAHLKRLAIVVSPLIALMKDQVDGLREAGVPAAYLNSSQTPTERAEVLRGLGAGRYHLLYVAPERLVMDGFAEQLARANPAFLAVDEAHCISQWGHDFRPEYRQLRVLREWFPGLAVHAYTATATPPVRADIIVELKLKNPAVLVGSFDRPNLVYRVRPRTDRLAQVLAAIARHREQAGIIYCIRRAEVNELAAALARRGLRALPYHAGLSDDERRANQEAFVNERADIVVATVAFGMGIDRSNVRYVVHAGMPKSLEHYQQEAGRAGRDGLEAECLLLHSGADYGLWKSVLGDPPPPGALRKLGEMYAFCQDAVCRHKALVTYFGQPYDRASCAACDVCLAETVQGTDTAAVTAKILNAAAQLRGSFGATHVADVLCGASTARIAQLGHDRLTAYGTLRGEKKSQVRAWIDQLMAQGYLARSDAEYPTLLVTLSGHAVLRGESAAAPLTSAVTPPAASAAKAGTPSSSREPRRIPESTRAPDTSGVADEKVFQALRVLRREVAEERGVPPYLIFSDASLRDMARLRPTTLERFREVKGVGDWKLETFGERFVAAVRQACSASSSARE
ncbi:MAG: ATP-dependent DNA helicase RecQ [Candidatus Rokubacteria bacterium 13_1_40CM_69_27]|nr:MAG: ATP-dependent DNA helicase RecQ [Candidatus Rokubacteria bacterium 13_1_40CM_69_27]